MRYKMIVEQIITDIREDKLSMGQRMPSLRQLASQHQVSITTALNSYRHLEARGWLVARPQSGFFVASPNIQIKQPIQPQFVSRPAIIAEAANSINAEHISGPLGISQLAPHFLPADALERSIKRGMRSMGGRVHLYPDPQGLHALRHAVATHFTESGFPMSADEPIITGGCIDAVRLALEATTKPGDGVAISSPCFNGLLELLSCLSLKVVEIPSTKEGIDLAQLEAHIKNGDVSAGLFNSSHMNPQGTSLSAKQKQALAELANRYEVPIVEDDIYAELAFDNNMPLPVKSWDKNGYVLWCGSVSKTLSAGFRLGWCLPGRFKENMVRQHGAKHLGHNTVVQSGLADFIRSGQYKRHVNTTRRLLIEHICAYRKLLQSCLPADAAISQPSGGMVLWVQVPRLNADQLYIDANKQGIDIRAGSFFTTRRLYRDCFRINAGWALTDVFDHKRTVEQAVRQLGGLISKQISRNSPAL